MATKALHCWLIHNGFISFKRQVKGIAQQLDLVTEEIVIKPNRFLYFVPLSLQIIYYYFHFKKKATSVYPLVAIGTGRMIVPVLLALKLLDPKNTFIIFVQKPAFPKRFFDLIVAPEHDAVKGDNALSSLGAINDFTEEQFNQLSITAKELEKKINKRPLIAFYLGGKTKKYSFDEQDAQALLNEIKKIIASVEASIVIVSSRRTGRYMETLLKQSFENNADVWVYTSDNPYNPYLDVLSLADYFFVTEDSVNLVSEACFTAKPVYLLKLPNCNETGRKSQFMNSMVEKALVCYYQAPLRPYSYPALREAQRLGPEIRTRIQRWIGEIF